MSRRTSSSHLKSNLFSAGVPIYIFGTSLVAFKTYLFLADLGLKIRGFICDYTFEEKYQSVNVFSRQYLDNQTDPIMLVNCTLTNFEQIRKYYATQDNIQQLTFYELARHYPEILNTIEFFSGMHEIIEKRKIEYREFADSFEDQTSRDMWFEVLENRKNFSFDLARVSFDPNQYFPNLIRVDQNEVLIDAGAHLGDTTAKFINLTSGHFNRVHVIEPQKKLLQKCERRFADYSNINYYQCVLSSECGTVKFSDDYGSGSRISENGVNYSAACIDTIVNDRVTFLKIDVEGSEMEVLNGSRNLINLHKPKIAVCVYHKQEHFLDIPSLILSIRSDYKVYFRHHSPGIFESVMYFI